MKQVYIFYSCFILAFMKTSKILQTDYLVIGSGLSGLYFAHHASKHGKVTIITKKKIVDSTSYLAQAGIASVLSKEDSKESHIEDTIRTGAGLSNRKIVEMVVTDGPARIRDFIDNFGVSFTRQNDGSLDLGLEGGHSKRRIAHIDDFTGKHLVNTIKEKVKSNPNIEIFENTMAIDLLSMAKYNKPNSCFGAFVIQPESNNIDIIIARATILATGGAGKVYNYSSNPDTAVGDGIAMAYRIGAQVSNMEFIQFHPTILYHHQAKSFLISEALRGEGGILRLNDGTAFMSKYSEKTELASRDVVARAIDSELKISGEDCVFLDMTHLDGKFLKERFPNIYKNCLKYGVDFTKDPIPVVPAAHYTCGGIQTNENGRTTVNNLFAIGESTHTGMHGACRLASNSLLEAVVFGYRACRAVNNCEMIRPQSIIPWKSDKAVSSDEGVVVTHNWDEIRRTMWNYVGIVRSDKRLKRANTRIKMIREEIHKYYWDFLVTAEVIELRNLALVADIIIHGASRRLESRGLHYNIDHQETSSFYHKNTVLERGNGPAHT